MRHTRLAEAFIAAALVVPCVAGADIFRYADPDGVVRYTDTPAHGGYSLYLRDEASFSLPAGEEYPYRFLVLEACRFYRVQEPLLRAVMEVESDCDRYAVSYAGARGLMQLMPETMKTVGVVNPFDPRQNIMGGARHLREMLNLYGNNLHLALAAYNAGVKAVTKYNNTIPPYPQTQKYVKDVLSRYSRYVQRSRGEGR
jgi:soluble lytic murein transglycosylase-like protein